MCIYKTTDLLGFLTDMFDSNAMLIELDINKDDSLSLFGLLQDESMIANIIDPAEEDVVITTKSDQPDYGIVFTFDELTSLIQSLTDVIEYYKDRRSLGSSDDMNTLEAFACDLRDKISRHLSSRYSLS